MYISVSYYHENISNAHLLLFLFSFLFFIYFPFAFPTVCALLFSFLASYLWLFASIVSRSYSSHWLFPRELPVYHIFMTILLLLLLLLSLWQSNIIRIFTLCCFFVNVLIIALVLCWAQYWSYDWFNWLIWGKYILSDC